MQREWARLIAEHGRIKPFGILVAIVLAALLLIEQELSDYDRVMEELTEREAVLREGQARAELLTRLEKTLAERKTSVAAVASRMIPIDPEAPGQGAAKFGEMLKSWYASHGINQAAISAVTPVGTEPLQYLRATVEAPMRLEQFVALLQGKRAAPLALRLVEADVRGNDARAPNGLLTRMTWEALRAPPKPVEPEPVKGGKAGEAKKSSATRASDRAGSERAEAGRTVERGGKAALPASLATEEKRR